MKALLITGFLFLSLLAFGQQRDKSDTLSRSERRELAKKEEEKAKAYMDSLINNQTWVLQAHTVVGKYNDYHVLNSVLNFVSVNKQEGTIQLVFRNVPNWNGIGGTTLEGEIQRYKVVKQGDNYIVSGTLFGNQGAITFRMYPSIYTATIELSGSFGDRVKLRGNLISPEESAIFKGSNVY